jgi:ABC-type transport system involved in multi-copper enzyme maturation permease subunit
MTLPAAPVLRRELQEQARRASSHWIRVAGTAGILFLFWRVTQTQAGLLGGSGRPLFLGLNKILFLIIWIVAPLMTADCLSREKREGTIGLLFLTPLSPWEVVLGKVVVHALRGLTLLLAAIPILILPILVGGVGVPDAVRVLLFQLSALGMALASGILASALVRGELAARLLAAAFTLLNSLGFLTIYITAASIDAWRSIPFYSQHTTFGAVWMGRLRLLWWNYGLQDGTFTVFGSPGTYGGIGWDQVASALGVALGSGLWVLLAAGLATRGLVRTWRPQEAGIVSRSTHATRERMLSRSRLLQPVAYRWLVHQVDPFGGRTTRLVLWTGIGLLLGAAFAEPFRWPPIGIRDALLLALFTAASSIGFARCLPEGAVELLSVTPTPLTSLATVWFARLRESALATGVSALVGSLAVRTFLKVDLASGLGALALEATLPLWLGAGGALAANLRFRGVGVPVAVLAAVACRHLALDLFPRLIQREFHPGWFIELALPVALAAWAIADLRRLLVRRA